MRVSDLIRKLSYGELSNLAMSSEGSGTIKEASIPKIIQYLNDGMLKLHSRFNLSEKNLLILQLAHVTNYHLKKRFAEASESNEENHYIKDLIGDPFEEDVIKVLEVYDGNGFVRPLNDKEDPYSVFTPQPDTIQVPNPVANIALAVTYQARHRPIIDHGNEVLLQEFQIPFFLEPAIQSYIAYKVYSHMNGQENKLISQEHLQTYEMVCIDVESKDLVNNTFSTQDTKLEMRGFV